MDFDSLEFFLNSSYDEDYITWLKQVELDGDYDFKLPSAVVVGLVVQALVALVGIVANFMVIFVTILGNNRQESSSITYVMNLSISNFIFLVTVPFKLLEDIYLRWTVGEIFCKIVTLIKFLNFSVVALFLMVMSIDRYLAVNRALSASHLRSQRASRIACFIVWSLGLVFSLPLALLHSAEQMPKCSPMFPGQQFKFNATLFLESNISDIPSPQFCKFASDELGTFLIWMLCNFFFSYFFPFVIIMSCYCIVIQRIRNPPGAVNAKGRLHRVVKRKVTQMALLLVISFAICYTPYYAWQVGKLIGIPVSSISVCAHVARFNTTMAYINSALNPILYASTSGQFSKQFRQTKHRLMSNKNAAKYMTSSSVQTRKTAYMKTTCMSQGKGGQTSKQLLPGSKLTQSNVSSKETAENSPSLLP